jgi:hypothetical protein
VSVSRAAAALAALAFAGCGCAFRQAPDAGPDATVQAGVKTAFGDPRRETLLHWEFGDGEAADGPAVQHAWARSGTYRVVATAPGGAAGAAPGSDNAIVTVVPRPASAAVPAWARAALLVPHPWPRARAAEALARRLLGEENSRDLFARVRDTLRFDPLVPLEIAGAGFDPEEGIAAFTAPGSGETIFLTVGVWDERRAEATVIAALQHAAEDLALEEHALGGARAVVARGRFGDDAEPAALGFTFSHGYLYIVSAAGEDGAGPVGMLSRVLEDAPDAGLAPANDARLLDATAGTPSADALFYLSPEAAAESSLASLVGADDPASVGRATLALALDDDGARVQARAFLELSTEEAVRARVRWRAPAPAPALAAHVRPDATALARVALSPAQLGAGLRVLGDDLGSAFRDALVPSLTGHAALGAYLDARRLARALGDDGELPLDAGAVVAIAELNDGPAAEDALARLLDERRGELRVDVTRGPEGTSWEIAPPRGPGLAFSVRGRLLGFALGGEAGERVRAALSAAPAPLASAAASGARALTASTDAAPAIGPELPDAHDRQTAFVDVRRLLAPFREAPASLADVLLAGWAELFEPVVSISLDLRAADAGIEGTATVRLR